MKQPFNPQNWLQRLPVNSDQYSVGSANTPSSPFTTSFSEIDQVITRIETAFTDITTSYTDWVHVGFALVNQFDEGGRNFFHRVSRFYNGYSKTETDKQYDQCLKSHGNGITIKTFFYLAQQAGIDIATNEARKEVISGQSSVVSTPHSGCHPVLNIFQDVSGPPQSFPPQRINNPSEDAVKESPPKEELPTLPDDLFDELPEFFKKVVMMADSKEERDILFLGAMVTLSSCLSKFSGYYNRKKVYPNLYLYVTAPASAGKGNMVMCRKLVDPVDEEKSRQSDLDKLRYDLEMREYNALKNKDWGVEKPTRPPVRMLFIPANNSTTGVYQLLADNDGSGLIFETEGDTIVHAFQTEYGDFSDGVRKAYHHEFISYFRRTDREHVRIKFPRLSIVISSTIGQLSGFIPSVENGLASRFMFYHMNMKPVWINVFSKNFNIGLDAHFDNLGQEFYSLYNSLKTVPDIDFTLTAEQEEQFNSYFSQLQGKYLVLQGMDYLAIIRRLGLMAFRMMMVLTAMRIPETGDFSPSQVCRDEDFRSVLSIINVLVRHASYVVSQLPAEVKVARVQNNKEKFFEGLAERFTYREFTELAKTFSIPESTAKRYITVFCDKGLITRESQGSYVKNSLQKAYKDQNRAYP